MDVCRSVEEYIGRIELAALDSYLSDRHRIYQGAIDEQSLQDSLVDVRQRETAREYFKKKIRQTGAELTILYSTMP